MFADRVAPRFRGGRDPQPCSKARAHPLLVRRRRWRTYMQPRHLCRRSCSWTTWPGLAHTLAVLACVTLLPGIAHAQASLAGVARDSSGAVLPGVTVEAAS